MVPFNLSTVAMDTEWSLPVGSWTTICYGTPVEESGVGVEMGQVAVATLVKTRRTER